MMERDHRKDLGVDVRKYLKNRSSRKSMRGTVWTGVNWLRIGTSGGREEGLL